MKLNLDFYKGEYTSKYEDGKYDEVFKTDLRWPVFYHLSKIRQNIISWYPIENTAEVLEIGSGIGAITGAICNKAKSVTCVELSKRRSMCNSNRNKDKNNLEIVVGNLNEISFEKKFDYITLNGVLEYASLYTESSNNPYIDFLNNIKKFLKKDGKLLIAIENKLGMKYFAGAPEDHTSKKYDGIEGYENKNGIQTFGKEEIKKLLENAGFKYTKFYYPLPDYKLPNIIFSDDYLPTVDSIENYTPYYYEGTEIEFNEKEAFKQAIKNGVFDIFANSFFIEASLDKIKTSVDLSKQELTPISEISQKFYDKDYSKVDYKAEKQNLEIEINAYKMEIESLKNQVKELTDNLKTIEKSTSWKITKPLRALNSRKNK